MALFKSLSGISGMWSQDMAIDLGTADPAALKETAAAANEAEADFLNAVVAEL